MDYYYQTEEIHIIPEYAIWPDEEDIAVFLASLGNRYYIPVPEKIDIEYDIFPELDF